PSGGSGTQRWQSDRPSLECGQAGRPVLLADYDDVEGVGQHRRAGRFLAFLGGRGRAVFGGQHVDAVRRRVHRHGAGAALGGHGVHGFIFAVDRFDDGHGAFAVGTERQAGIEARAIGAGANRRRGDHFHGGDIGDGHHLIAAHAEELLVLDVDGQAGWAFTRGKRGAARHDRLGGVDLHNLAGIFDIDVEFAGAVHHAILRLLTDREGGYDLIVPGVDGGGVVAPAIHGEDALRLGLVADGIGILAADGGLAGLFQRLEIEDGHGAGLPVGDEALADVAGHGDAVYAVQLGDLSDHLAGLDIHDFHDATVRGEDTLRYRVHGEVIPAAGAAYFDFVEDLIAFGAERGEGE